MWPFKKEPKDSLAENLVLEVEILSRSAGDWKSCSAGSYDGLQHKGGIKISRFGVPFINRCYINVSDSQEERLRHCYNEMLIAKALSACVNKE